MIEVVIKKDSREEPFNEEKIKNAVKAAALEAGLDEEKQIELSEAVVKNIEESFSSQNTIKSIELREKVLSQLDLLSPETAQSWRDYEIAHKNQ